MKNIQKILTISIIFAVSLSGYSQDKKAIERANELYKDYAYVEATKIYEKIANKGFVNQDILQKLGNSYYFRADYVNSLKWFEQLFQKLAEGEYKQVSPECYYRYAQTLKSAERYDESNKIMEQFVKMTSPNNKLANLFKKNSDYLADIKRNSGRVDISLTQVNTEYSEYGPAFLGDEEIVYTANTTPKFFGRVSEWTDASMYNIYKTQRVNDSIKVGNKVSSNINTKSLNESTAVFTKDGNTMYFTRNKPYDTSEGSVKEKDFILKIYKAQKNGASDWGDVKQVPLAGEGYSVAHPALSPDEKYLYFASNIPGTMGDSDIYRVEIKEDGTYGTPENLGADINTNGRESFPFITADNVLYFASDGYPGLGGLDIYAVKIKEDGTFGKCQNVGRPLNSPYDDFSLIFNSDTKVGYFSSNRPGGVGSDDIYMFHERKPLVLDCSKLIKCIVKDKYTGKVIQGATVVLSSKKMEEKGKLDTDSDGLVDFQQSRVPCDQDYCYLRASKEGYGVEEKKVSLITDSNEVSQELYLQTSKERLVPGMDLAKVFNIKEILFDFDKSDIRPDAQVELSKIVEVMKEYPTMVVEIKSHTDSRGSANYNRKLSDRRAKSTAQWIIEQGISSDRISGKGYGEDQLLNGCSNGVNCTEEQHQENRRSEFIIARM